MNALVFSLSVLVLRILPKYEALFQDVGMALTLAKQKILLKYFHCIQANVLVFSVVALVLRYVCEFFETRYFYLA